MGWASRQFFSDFKKWTQCRHAVDLMSLLRVGIVKMTFSRHAVDLMLLLRVGIVKMTFSRDDVIISI